MKVFRCSYCGSVSYDLQIRASNYYSTSIFTQCPDCNALPTLLEEFEETY
ncbi:MAG: hypothetical protein ACE5K0_06755 [Candidatus Methanofastidiosia archaeon]